MTLRRQTLPAWLFLAPALVLLALFSFWPVAYGSWLAFTDYSLVRPTSFVAWIISAPSSTTRCSSPA